MNIITKKQDRAPFKLAMPASQCGNIHPSAWHHGVFYPPSPDFSMPQCISVYSLSAQWYRQDIWYQYQDCRGSTSSTSNSTFPALLTMPWTITHGTTGLIIIKKRIWILMFSRHELKNKGEGVRTGYTEETKIMVYH